jgi:hypothetical protein
MTTKPKLQKILQGILYTGDENKQNHKRMGSIKTTGKEKTSYQRVALNRLHALKSLKNKNN